MGEDALADRDVPAEPFSQQADALTDSGPRPVLGLVLALLLALGASAGLAWWIAAPDRGRALAEAPPPPPAPPSQSEPAPQPLSFAAADPDPGQVRRAWADVQRAYVDGGIEALTRGSQTCAKGVPGDPGLLDYCLAYDRYALTIAPAAPGEWFGDAGARDLALARTALPEGVDPSNRIEQVTALTTAVLPKPKPKPKPAAKPHRVHHAAPKAKRLAHPFHPTRRTPQYPKAKRPVGDAVLQARDGRSPLADVMPPEAFDPPH